MTTATQTKKITLATIKSFIRKNRDRLLISTRSRFDAMEDGCRECSDRGFSPALQAEKAWKENLGIQGAWFVGGSRNFFEEYADGNVVGYEVSNCCGHFVLAVVA